MGAYYDEIEIEDMAQDDEKRVYHYPCPCGDPFEISRDQLADCEDIATCPSCSLIIRVIYDPVRLLGMCLARDPVTHYFEIWQLDFEDEPSDDNDSGVEEVEEEEDDVDEGDDDYAFEDALERMALQVDETPKTVAVSA